MGGLGAPVLLCIAVQNWYELLVEEVEDVIKEDNVIESEEVQSHRTTVFEGEARWLDYVRATGIYSDPRVNGLRCIVGTMYLPNLLFSQKKYF